MCLIKSTTWLISSNVIHYSSPLLFSLHLWIHLCLQSDSGVVLSGQSDKLPANSKKKKKKKKMRHPASIYPFLPLSSLCNLIPLFIAQPCGSLVNLKLLQPLPNIFINCCFPLPNFFPPLCSSF